MPRITVPPIQFTKAELQFILREMDAHFAGEVYRSRTASAPIVDIRKKVRAALGAAPPAPRSPDAP